MALPLAPRSAPPRHTSQPTQTHPRGQKPSRAGGTAVISRIVGFVLLGIAVWGIWVAAEIPRYAETDILGKQQGMLNGMIVLLSWLVLFGPFAYFGFVLVRKSFAEEERSWLIPLRVFTYLVGRRFSVERQRREFFEDAVRAKPLAPSPPQEYLDVQANPSKERTGR